MKYLVFAFLLFMSACNKTDDEPTLHWGEVSAVKNGTYWEAEIYAGNNEPYSQGIDLLIEKFNDLGHKREDLFLFKIPLSSEKFSLTNTSVRDIDSLVGADYSTLQDDGVGGDRYFLLLNDSIADYIEIKEIEGKEIKGNFQMSFVKDLTYGEAEPNAPDTIVFLDGKFHTRLID